MPKGCVQRQRTILEMQVRLRERARGGKAFALSACVGETAPLTAVGLKLIWHSVYAEPKPAPVRSQTGKARPVSGEKGETNEKFREQHKLLSASAQNARTTFADLDDTHV